MYNISPLFHTFRFHTDPSGTFVRYEAKAIGAGAEGAQTTLQVRTGEGSV